MKLVFASDGAWHQSKLKDADIDRATARPARPRI